MAQPLRLVLCSLTLANAFLRLCLLMKTEASALRFFLSKTSSLSKTLS
ncbi:hypothetical protein QWZ13_15480 [Reinekea marina]|nr:hypothetical protein [Reinekea marina]MDN3650310.1 hypothetical protein [Reinekea marina]